ncbi:MAG: hypothetical protein ACRD3W_14890, partial [Terriglobales bacterium]
ASLTNLCKLKKLNLIDAAGQQLTPDDVSVLKCLPALTLLTITTPESNKSKIEKLLPKCRIIINNNPENINPQHVDLDLFSPLH